MRGKRTGPDYRLCRQTVSLYHAEFGPGGAFACERRVMRGAYMELRRSWSADRLGDWEETGFLLVLPSGADGRPVWAGPEEYGRLEAAEREERFCVRLGDRVMEGEGPEIGSREEWERFIPAKVEGLAVVKQVSVYRWQGEVCHVEAGARSQESRLWKKRL